MNSASSGVATSGRESPIECSFVVYALRIKCDRILSQKPELEGGKEEKKFENFLYQARGVEQGEVVREEVVLVMQCDGQYCFFGDLRNAIEWL